MVTGPGLPEGIGQLHTIFKLLSTGGVGPLLADSPISVRKLVSRYYDRPDAF